MKASSYPFFYLGLTYHKNLLLFLYKTFKLIIKINCQQCDKWKEDADEKKLLLYNVHGCCA